MWNPHKLNHIGALGNCAEKSNQVYPLIQRAISYVDRLKKLKLPALAYRRARGDMIETFNILNQYDPDVTPNLRLHTHTNTRGHAQKLLKSFKSQ